jgi:GNAT superfamily N-acetyltransferase
VTTYSLRAATIDDIPHIARHREQMFRDMAIPADFDAMAAAATTWLATAIPDRTYRGWLAITPDGMVVAGAGLIVIPWPPGPFSMDPRCGFVFNVYTEPAHRKQGVGRRLMEAIHQWCRGEGIERVVLNASTFGLAMYSEMGYVVSDEPMLRLKL